MLCFQSLPPSRILTNQTHVGPLLEGREALSAHHVGLSQKGIFPDINKDNTQTRIRKNKRWCHVTRNTSSAEPSCFSLGKKEKKKKPSPCESEVCPVFLV